MDNNSKFFTKSMIPFLICGLLAWASLVAVFAYTKWTDKKESAAAVEQTIEEPAIVTEAPPRQVEKEEMPQVSSTRRFDTLTPTEAAAIDFTLSNEYTYDAEEDLYVQIVLSNDTLIFVAYTDDYVTANICLLDAMIEEGLAAAIDKQEIIAKAIGKQLNYGYAVMLGDETIYFQDAARGVVIE